MSTNVEIVYLCGAGFGFGVLALGLYFAYSSGRERDRPGKAWQENRDE